MTLTAQAVFTSFFTGDTANVISNTYSAGIVLAGGGPDNDNAMRWMLNRAGGGDVLVLRAAGSDGYNDYFFSELGATINSVETIRFNDAAAANSPYVIRRIQEAELIFLAGGNQTDYVDYWRDTPIATAMNEAINEKGITIGGTSAGMAVLGQFYYAPINQGAISQEALGNPFHPNVEGISVTPFLTIPFLANTITDTHFEARDRQGRTLVFLARAAQLSGQRPFGITANDATAICVDETGVASIFGDFPEYPDYAHFILPGCTDDAFGPETMEPNTPFTWSLEGRATSVYRVAGTPSGGNTFDLSTWLDGTGGSWQNWSVNNGQWIIDASGEPPVDCAISSVNNSVLPQATLFPNPLGAMTELINVNVPLRGSELFDGKGRSLQRFGPQQRQFNLQQLPAGIYWLRVTTLQGRERVWKVLKQ
ncbi:MAG: Type 1 glutamine amidotransferase-like domain-containing protein [Bacteroidota bacterium]